ncbi:MAG: ATP-dependent RecD-like DNA helicase [Desulfobacterales bacterium]|nr:ATP-dependent RecD-like DNA helicase [Desulfobacterales bacterium]
MKTDLTGQIERITFFNEENNFAICKIKVKGERNLVTVVGNMMNPTPGEILKMQGKWIDHPKFGTQFRIDTYKTQVPATEFGIKKYLGSGLIKGIGPVMADRIVKEYGSKSLDIIENNISKLLKVEGIGKKRISMIEKAWEEQKEIRNVMLFLQSHEVSSAYATKIFKQYGDDAIEVVTENPYRLADDIFGIGFITADKIAEKFGFEKDSILRIESGILFTLHSLSNEGHVCYPFEDLVKKAEELLETKRDRIVEAIDIAKHNKKIVIEETIEQENIILKSVFLSQYFFSEKGIASRLKSIKAQSSSIRKIDAGKTLDWVQGEVTIKLAKMQKKAITMALDEKLLVITGGPGTGKTTIINAIIKIYKKLGIKILLAAPTGRAAKRMNEATFHPATTIHRMLKYSMIKAGFEKDETNPLKCDLLILDESSMIDTYLMYQLLKAVPDFCSIIFVGDVNQLPSVGAGNVLNDIILSGMFSVVELDTIFRQARKSLIIVNAHRINNGDFPFINSDEKSDFFFIQREEVEDVVKTIVELGKVRIQKKYGFDPINDIQVLTPMHRGLAGSANLNVELQKALNPGESGLSSLFRGNREFKVNDKVMQIRNNYDKLVFNGDIGAIGQINFENQKLIIVYNKREVEYDFSELDEIIHAYAVSIHKSQGSEYPVVIIPIVTQHYILLQRNLIYTAVTRGKKLVIMVGTKKALAMAVNTVKSEKRFTGLKRRLTW